MLSDFLLKDSEATSSGRKLKRVKFTNQNYFHDYIIILEK